MIYIVDDVEKNSVEHGWPSWHLVIFTPENQWRANCDAQCKFLLVYPVRTWYFFHTGKDGMGRGEQTVLGKSDTRFGKDGLLPLPAIHDSYDIKYGKDG